MIGCVIDSKVTTLLLNINVNLSFFDMSDRGKIPIRSATTLFPPSPWGRPLAEKDVVSSVLLEIFLRFYLQYKKRRPKSPCN